MVSPSMLGVDAGDFLERVDDGLGEEGHEAQLDAVLLHEVVLVFRVRSSMTADMSTSLKVVSMAASCWAETRRLGDLLAQLGQLAAGLPGGRRGTGAGGRRGGGGNRGAPASAGLSPAASISPLVTRPPLPVPATVAGSMPVSAARRRTAGEGSREIFGFDF
jgi:hypothetical protein